MHEREHLALVIGAGVAGSEAAYVLAQHGIRVIVVDQNALPYGKIEDGLPKWHTGLRDRVEAEIDRKLRHEKIKFLPLFKVGKDMSLPKFWKITNSMPSFWLSVPGRTGLYPYPALKNSETNS